MFGIPGHRFRTAYLAGGTNEIDSIVGLSTLVTLISPCVLVTAVGAGTADIPVREELPALRAVQFSGGPGVNVPLVMKCQEKVLDYFVVSGVGRPGEEVECYLQLIEIRHRLPMKMIHHFLRGLSLLLRTYGDRGPVLVGT